jgi:signal transduction histidine kinase
MESGKDSAVEYRMVRPDRSVRWLASYGRRHSRTGGAPYILMGVTIDITEPKRLERERTNLARLLLNTQEAERTRIARELHDDLGQSIALCGLQLQQATTAVELISPEAAAPLVELRKNISHIAQQVSTLSHQLHSSELEFMGLAVAAQRLCREVSERHQVQVTCSCDGLPKCLGAEASLCLFGSCRRPCAMSPGIVKLAMRK